MSTHKPKSSESQRTQRSRHLSQTAVPVRLENNELDFVVGIGASAGGLASIESLLRRVEPDSNSALVIIQHLSPDLTSSMGEILTRSTQMDVRIIQHQQVIEPGYVYLIPSGKEVWIEDGAFSVGELDRTQVTRVVDTFFRSLAENFGPRAIAIVLSGSGSDGSEGVKAIHQAKGIAIVEAFESAQFDTMPKTAVATGCVSKILTSAEIGAWLTKQFDDPSQRPASENTIAPEDLTGIDLIFSLLSRRHDVDFSQYKPSTVARRIDRRQKICRQQTIFEYADYVNQNPQELGYLYQDLLIGVTKFFRDREMFDIIERCVDELVKNLPEDETFRVWSAGCASGEEPYSLAMLLNDAFERHGRPAKFKVFATDIHQGMLETASRGIFGNEELEFVSEERIRKYFLSETSGNFRVKTNLRRHLVFARHNVFKDPPFTRMHLVLCRNLLIYLKQAAQVRALMSLQFSLRVDGLLVLGRQ